MSAPHELHPQIYITSVSDPRMMKMDTLPSQDEFGTQVMDEIITNYHPAEVARKVDAIIDTRGEGYTMQNLGPEKTVNPEVLFDRAVAVQKRAEEIGQPSRLEQVVKLATTLSGALIGLVVQETILDNDTLPVVGFLATSMATAYFGRKRTVYSRAYERIRKARSND